MDNVPSLLKAFVIAGAVVLVVGTVLLIALLVLRPAGDDREARADAPPQPRDLSLPAGARIEQIVVDGKRLVLLATDPAGRQYLAVVDALSGERLSLLRVGTAP